MVGERIETHADLVAKNAALAKQGLVAGTAPPPGAPVSTPTGVYVPSAGYVSRLERVRHLQKVIAADAFPPAPKPGTGWRKWEQTGASAMITVLGCAVDDEAPEPRALVFYRSQDGNNYCVSLGYWHDMIVLPRGKIRRFERTMP